MNHTLRWILWLQVAFFGAWGIYLLTSHHQTTVVWLETAPVDPRDWISGHYVALRYPIQTPSQSECASILSQGPSGSVYVRLQPSGKTILAQGPVSVWEAAECRTNPPAGDSPQVWIKGDRLGASSLRYGIERFYVTEDSRLRSVTSGQVIAKISVNRRHQARLLDLKIIHR